MSHATPLQFACSNCPGVDFRTERDRHARRNAVTPSLATRRLGRHPESVTLQVVCRVYPLTVYSPVSCSVLTFQAAYHASTKRSVRGGSSQRNVDDRTVYHNVRWLVASVLRRSPNPLSHSDLFSFASNRGLRPWRACEYLSFTITYRATSSSRMDGSAAGGEHSACLPLYSCAACWPRRARPLSARRMPLAM